MDPGPSGIVALFLLGIATSYSAPDFFPEIMDSPPDAEIAKRETLSLRKTDGRDFIEQKLIQHSQALEQLLKMGQSTEDLIMELVENLSKHLFEQPRLPEKVEVLQPSRRSNSNSQMNLEIPKNPIATFGKTINNHVRNIPKYGDLVRRLFMHCFQDRSDPTPLVERLGHSKDQTIVSQMLVK